MTEVPDHPILFTTDMVQAVDREEKIETRRVILPQPPEGFEWNQETGLFHPPGVSSVGVPRRCPFGKKWDRLFIRETWATWIGWDDVKPSELAANSRIFFKSLGEDAGPFLLSLSGDGAFVQGTPPSSMQRGKWRPNIFLPKKFTRRWLTVTEEIRAERVQDITDDGALAEGVQGYAVRDTDIDGDWYPGRPRALFRGLWNSINATRGYGWQRNPWVWVVSFTRRFGWTLPIADRVTRR